MTDDIVRRAILTYIKARMEIMPSLNTLIKSSMVILEREAEREIGDKSGCVLVPANIFCSLLAAFTTSEKILEIYNILDDKSVAELEEFVKKEDCENFADMQKAAEVMADNFIKKIMKKP